MCGLMRSPHFPHVRVEGGPRERGRQYGEQARESIHLSISSYREVFMHYAQWDSDVVRREALRFEGPIEAYGRPYLEELQGIADGAGVPFEDVLAINVRTEVMFAATARAAQAAFRGGECSSVAVLPETSATRHTLLAQNWDWLLHCSDTVVVLEARQEDGPNFVSVVEAGLLAKTGMNSSGIGVVTNALVSASDRGDPGVPYHVLLRALMDCENVSDALMAVQRSLRSSSANYLVGHEDGLALDLEAGPGDFGQVFLLFPEKGVLLHTNHFLSPSFHGKDVSIWAMPDSPIRLERLRTAVQLAERPLSVPDVQAMLADHANHPAGVCCHPDPRLETLDQGATVASVVMDLDARMLWVAAGHPCTTPYRRLDLGDLLAKPSAVRNRTPA
jgi:isopenicillin-N N-acyltransferase-like protein